MTKNGLHARVLMVTPAMAKAWLDAAFAAGANFRHMDRSVVLAYVNDMRHLRWEINGEPLIFRDGLMVDGQHRMRALIDADCTLPFVIVDAPSAMSIDQGRARTVGQYVAKEGLPNANVIASGVRYVLLHDDGSWNMNITGDARLTKHRILDYTMANRDVLIACGQEVRKANKILNSGILFPIVHIGCDRRRPADNPVMFKFLAGLICGDGLLSGNPILMFRNLLASQSKRSPITSFAKRMLLTLAWNKFAMGESCKLLRFVPPGPNEIVVVK